MAEYKLTLVSGSIRSVHDDHTIKAIVDGSTVDVLASALAAGDQVFILNGNEMPVALSIDAEEIA